MIKEKFKLILQHRLTVIESDIYLAAYAQAGFTLGFWKSEKQYYKLAEEICLEVLGIKLERVEKDFRPVRVRADNPDFLENVPTKDRRGLMIY